MSKLVRVADVFNSDDALRLAIKYYDLPNTKKDYTSILYNLFNIKHVKRVMTLYITVDRILEYKRYPKTLLLMLLAVREGKVYYKLSRADHNATSILHANSVVLYNDSLYTEIIRDDNRRIVNKSHDNRINILEEGITPKHLNFLINEIYRFRLESSHNESKIRQNKFRRIAENILET